MAKSSPDPDLDAVARGVLQLARRLKAERGPASVTTSGLGLLASLHSHGPMSAAALARMESLAPQSLSRLLTALDTAGYISRKPDKVDHRAWILSVTAAGRRVLERDMKARRDWLETSMASALTASERQILAKAAALMIKVADAR